MVQATILQSRNLQVLDCNNWTLGCYDCPLDDRTSIGFEPKGGVYWVIEL